MNGGVTIAVKYAKQPIYHYETTTAERLLCRQRHISNIDRFERRAIFWRLYCLCIFASGACVSVLCPEAYHLPQR